MPTLNVIPFPVRKRDPLFHRRGHRPAWRAPAIKPRQTPLPLPAESDLDKRINAAKATAANYEEMADKADRPVTKCLYRHLAAKWNGRVLALIAERPAQLELPQANGTTGGAMR